jgi:hypothetical protein
VELPDSIEPDRILQVPPAGVWTVLTRPDQIQSGSHESDMRGWQREPGELEQYLATRS